MNSNRGMRKPGVSRSWNGLTLGETRKIEKCGFDSRSIAEGLVATREWFESTDVRQGRKGMAGWEDSHGIDELVMRAGMQTKPLQRSVNTIQHMASKALLNK
jgi:hypothetical protein